MTDEESALAWAKQSLELRRTALELAIQLPLSPEDRVDLGTGVKTHETVLIAKARTIADFLYGEPADEDSDVDADSVQH